MSNYPTNVQQQFQNQMLTQFSPLGDPFALQLGPFSSSSSSSSQGSSSSETAGAYPAVSSAFSSADNNRLALLGIGDRPLSKRFQKDPNYNPFAIRERTDHVGYGGVKTDRVAAVKQSPEFSGMTDAQIAKVLHLGAPKRTGNFGRTGVTRAETQALENIAARHHIKIVPELNARPTALTWLNKKKADALAMNDQKAYSKWSNYEVAEEDLDHDASTADNIIIRNSDNPNDVFAVDGMRVVDRTKSLVKRGVYEEFPTKKERTDNKDIINKVYKRYLRKYLTPTDRARHPWSPEMAQSISNSIDANESAYSKFARIIRAVLVEWGVKVKAPNNATILTVPHWGYISSKFISKLWKTNILPNLLRASTWSQVYPQGYDFEQDADDLLSNKASSIGIV
ncbi:hypothetical protein FACS189472_06390 [Alphaproteobacteria bacterium]|nr:hypothetical protein FACS189472_06390 [Alphaproteobacteria bacterium]